MQQPKPMTIQGPEYEMLQTVWLHYEEQAYPTSVRKRAYDPDTERWIYLLGLTGRWHTAEELGPRVVEKGQADEFD